MKQNNIKQENHGTGGVKDVPDVRDYQYSDIAGSTSPFDWNLGYDVETIVGKLPVKNQAQTSACGGFAWATYSYVLDPTNREEKSEKFIYAQTHVLGGGSSGRDNCDLVVKKGDCSKTLCPLPEPLTEALITNQDDITAIAYSDALTNEEKSYLAVNTDIDSVAQAMRDSSGVIIGIQGVNNGTWLSKFPTPFDIQGFGNTKWNHWVYCGKALLINGKKYIGFLNSWGTSVGDNGWQYISEDYFNGTFVWSCWTMMYNANIKYIFVPTIRFGQTGLAVKMLQLKLGIPADGVFGRITAVAVALFQRQHNLVADSVCGKLTCLALNNL